ncbi:MAG: hypothetical protein CMI02_06135 [Oceanospirillaceae bacterium]|nr:hypothetical protein [Oceanospirillaceae bacterium]MBT11593.1 hypothetical protein [Oceanospirillaceae bacterium]|tara:strand:- start:105383 stop:105643 length:261 start_codon:yes stop_codon:yes gene_type:complete
MKLMFNKFATLVFWLLVILAQVFSWPGLLSWLPACGLAVLAIHVLEVLYFWFAFRSQSHAVGKDALQILIFGIFHLRRFIDEQAEH